jgi:acyl dehydratase
MSVQLITEPSIGTRLTGLVKHISQAKINKFGCVSGGVGAIHLEPNFGKKTQFKTTLVQGYMLLGYITEMLKNNFGIKWCTSGNMEIKLVGPAKQGDTLVVGGEIENIENGIVLCNVWIKNHAHENVAVGKANIPL